MALLECVNGVLGYDGNPVVENLNFSVHQEDYLCVIGENGAGKSTLIRTILRLQPLLSGKIIWGDELNPAEIGYLPQQTVVQKDFPASVKEIVLSGCLNSSGLRPFYTREQKQRAQENIERLGITHLANRCYRELSGGQQQRVLLARALCATKKMILLDEPVAGLDPKATRELYLLVQRLNREAGIAVIMVSHDLSAAMEYASHILHVAHEPLFFGRKEDYLESEAGRRFVAASKGGERHA